MTSVLTSPNTLTTFEEYADDVMCLRYSHVVQNRKEAWEDIAQRVCAHVMYNEEQDKFLVPRDIVWSICKMIVQRKFIPGGRILSQAGREYHQTDNCYCLRATDTREGWADLAHKCTMMFMSGGGVGVDYSQIRPYGGKLGRSGGIASGPIPLIQMINSIGAAARQGGERRGAIYASLAYDHGDIFDFIKLKQQGGLEHTNISVRFHLDKTDVPVIPWKDEVWKQTIHHAVKYGDPGFQFDNDDQILRNACTEIISADDGDSCCLGSLNLAKIANVQELAEVTNLAVLFLLCNTLYTHTPTQQVADVKADNRRIGLGLMGVAEWFIQRGLPYGCYSQYQTADRDDTFPLWMQMYKQSSEQAATQWANYLNIATPIATRAIAPTGTISSAIGHTTPGIEPLFHTAYMRTYNTLKDQDHSNGYVKQVVIDPIVSKMIAQGYNIEDIDTAYTLSQTAEGIERRIAFQAFCQQYVDNAISSTVNLPPYVEGIEDTIAPILLRYLPQLRGITFYPDGRYDNQPVVPIDIKDALAMQATLQEHESCKGGSCGV